MSAMGKIDRPLGRDAWGGTKPMAKVIFVYWLFSLFIAIAIPESPDSMLASVLIKNLKWVREALPAIDSLAQVSSMPTVASCFFSLMWVTFPVFAAFMYIRMPEVAEKSVSKLLKAILLGVVLSLIIFWFFALSGKSHDVGITHSRGAYAMQFMASNRVGLSMVGTMFIAAFGFVFVGSFKCAARIVQLQASSTK